MRYRDPDGVSINVLRETRLGVYSAKALPGLALMVLLVVLLVGKLRNRRKSPPGSRT